MTRDRSPRRLRRRDRNALIAAALTALSLTTSGCVVVHGEREVLPAATKSEATHALGGFLSAYNKAQAANDGSLDASRETGALEDIDGAKLTAAKKIEPGGNSAYTPMEFTDTKVTIPKKAGWPRWFVTDSASNRDKNRWLLVFTRDTINSVWQVAYLTVLSPGDVPVFKKDADGYAEPVKASDATLAVAPGKLPKAYATYLQKGGKAFAAGPFTTTIRTSRAATAAKPGLARQYVDEPLTAGDYAPLGLRTKDGGALVFFASRHYQKQTVAAGVNITITDANIKALLSGDVKTSLTLETVANQAVYDPAKGDTGSVEFLSRVSGLTGAKGQ
ncbi:hypothetical protein OK074_6310 [Actinobacteria bacterium OK074]|nr:hypothetical protein OK074_6310 [Actinobacteria bacterium OK074]